MLKKLTSGILAAIAFAGLAGQASASSVLFSGSSGNLAASANFDLSGTTLTVTLTNTTLTPISQNADLLFSVFWHSDSAIGGTLSSTNLGAGASKYWPNGSASAITDLDEGGFGYAKSIPTNGGGGLTNQQYGVSAVGLGVTYDGGLVGLNGATPVPNIDGGDGGLAGVNGGSASNGNKPAIMGSLVYTITGVSDAFNLNCITNVRFQYGTSFTETQIPGNPPGGTPNNPVPVPAAAWTGLSLLAGMGAIAKLRRRRA